MMFHVYYTKTMNVVNSVVARRLEGGNFQLPHKNKFGYLLNRKLTIIIYKLIVEKQKHLI